MLDKIFENTKAVRPLVHNITNYVTATDCANITLAVGGSPIMADEPLEAGEITAAADALVINTGTISMGRATAMLISGKAAKKKGIPVILDPVGAGASRFRTEAIRSVLSEVKPDIIRLNTSELKSLCLDTANLSGVDAGGENDTADVISLAKAFAQKTGAVIGVSGMCDIVTDGTRTAVIKSGHEMMRKITGMGCMLSSIIGAFAAANSDDLFSSAVCAFALFGKCGKNAFSDGIGTGTYKVRFFDEISNARTEDFEIEYR